MLGFPFILLLIAMSFGRLFGFEPEQRLRIRSSGPAGDRRRQLYFVLVDVSLQVLAVGLTYVLSQQLLKLADRWRVWRPRKQALKNKGDGDHSDLRSRLATIVLNE